MFITILFIYYMNNDNFTGICIKYYKKDKTKMKSEVFMNNGKKEGFYKEYYDNDKTKLKSEIFMNNGKKEGFYKSYHKNGKIWEDANYIGYKLKKYF